MQVIRGDLIQLARQGRFDVIIHGANCQCAMGAGIAKAIRETFPEAYEADRRTRRADPAKLGTISWADVSRDGVRFVVVNAYTQFDFRGRGVRVDYDAVRSAMREVKRRFSGKRIGIHASGRGSRRATGSGCPRSSRKSLRARTT